VPELPETETIARDLDREVRGRAITGVEVRKGDVLRIVTTVGALSRRLVGARITRVWRRAKLVVTDVDSGDRLVVQPRFTGALILATGDAGAAVPEPAAGAGQHDAVGTLDDPFIALCFALDDDRTLAYRDVRRLGTVALMSPPEWTAYEGALGDEPLDPAFTAERLSAILRSSKQGVKQVLMDQRRVAGIGNIYATEALWRAGIDPSRQAARVASDTPTVTRLHREVQDVLQASIAARGTTFRDFRDAYGGRGAFAALLQAYGRSGQPCARCGRTLVGTHAIDGRMTVFCPTCQS
jgi:formamidopyrimidine-DNA glycosylase